MEKRHRTIPVALLALAVAVLAATHVPAQTGSAGRSSIDSPDSDDVMWAYQNAFRRAAQEALPVVVKIDVIDVITQQVPSLQNPFSFFFGNRDQEEPEQREYRRPGLGSGVIVRRAGEKVYILTNNHVVGEADEITVSLHDGRQFPASVIGADENRDLALIKFETVEDVPIAQLGDSDDLAVGDWVFAVGNPLGFESTVTSGIVSAVGRRPSGSSSISEYTDYLQTDAAINQGNSGGALVNLAGEVVGINTWIASRSGGNIGLGFAIPINNAKRAIDEFIAYGAVEYGWLGIVYGGSLNESVVASLRASSDEGALVGSVYAESPAARGGLLPGDVITAIGDEDIESWSDLVNVVANTQPGQTLRFRVTRSGSTIFRRVTVARRPSDEETATLSEFWPGLVVTPLTDEMRSGLGLRSEPGQVIVADVVASGPASEAGIRRGDVIRRVGEREIESLQDFYEAMNEGSRDELALRVARQGRELIIGLIR
jgi:serine protease Do